MAQSSSPRELRFTVNGMNFAAQEWGDSTQLPVLALHGWLDNAASFYALAPRLNNLHIVALDMAGHGQSEHRPGHMAYTPWDDINDILAVADHLGWERFTDQVIAQINSHCSGIVFLLWGSHAINKQKFIDKTRHHVLTAPHPSPLSAHRGFLGCGHFAKANELLAQMGKTPVDWQV